LLQFVQKLQAHAVTALEAANLCAAQQGGLANAPRLTSMPRCGSSTPRWKAPVARDLHARPNCARL
jgi:hypothetical protein